MFREMSDELYDAVVKIRDECASHPKTCVDCPFWLNNGTVHQYCGLNWGESFDHAPPAFWEVRNR